MLYSVGSSVFPSGEQHHSKVGTKMKREVSCMRNGQLGENPASLSYPSGASGQNRKHTGQAFIGGGRWKHMPSFLTKGGAEMGDYGVRHKFSVGALELSISVLQRYFELIRNLYQCTFVLASMLVLKTGKSKNRAHVFFFFFQYVLMYQKVHSSTQTCSFCTF